MSNSTSKAVAPCKSALWFSLPLTVARHLHFRRIVSFTLMVPALLISFDHDAALSQTPDPCSALLCLSGALTGQCGTPACAPPTEAFYAIKVFDPIYDPVSTATARAEFLQSCPVGAEANEGQVAAIIEAFGALPEGPDATCVPFEPPAQNAAGQIAAGAAGAGTSAASSTALGSSNTESAPTDLGGGTGTSAPASTATGAQGADPQSPSNSQNAQTAAPGQGITTAPAGSASGLGASQPSPGQPATGSSEPGGSGAPTGGGGVPTSNSGGVAPGGDQSGPSENNSGPAEASTGSVWDDLTDVAGKVWNLPNTAAGIAYGGVGYVAGLIEGTNPQVSIGNNAIQFTGNPLNASALTLGNTINYGVDSDGINNMPNDKIQGHDTTLGNEEMQHTYQGQILGPLYLPANAVSMGASVTLDTTNNGHGPSAFMESGPHDPTKPTPF